MHFFLHSALHNFEISFTFQSIFKAAIQIKTFTFGHVREAALAATVSQSILKFSYENFFVPHATIHPVITKAIVTQEKLDLRHPVLAITVSFLHIIRHVVCFSRVPIQRSPRAHLHVVGMLRFMSLT